MPITSASTAQSAPKPVERAKPKPIQPRKTVQSIAPKSAPPAQLDPNAQVIIAFLYCKIYRSSYDL